jgi:hypothetical protein
MRWVPLSVPLILAVAAGLGTAARAETADVDRPSARELRFSEADLMARLVAEVSGDKVLRGRALALWRTHFEAQAAELQRRFATEADWRDAFGEAAILVDEFLEASDLPRAGRWRAGEDQEWVERLDPQTGRRTRHLQPVRRAFDRLLAPVIDKRSAPASGKTEGERTNKPAR